MLFRSHGLETKIELVVLTKTDLVSREEVEQKRRALEDRTQREVQTVSVEDADALKKFSDWLAAQLGAQR